MLGHSLLFVSLQKNVLAIFTTWAFDGWVYLNYDQIYVIMQANLRWLEISLPWKKRESRELFLCSFFLCLAC